MNVIDNNLELWDGSDNVSQVLALEQRGVTVAHDPVGNAIVGRVRLQGRRVHYGGTVFLDGIASTSVGAGYFVLPNVAATTEHSVKVAVPGYLDAEWLAVDCTDWQATTLPPVTLLGGDANNDGIIDVSDLALAASHFGSSMPEADINADGVVNILDLTLIGMNFGKTESPWTG